MRDWDSHFINHAILAAEMSTCRRRNVGAVTVRDRRILSTGFNGNAPGAVHCSAGGCHVCEINEISMQPPATGLKECVCIHAEVNAIAWAAREGVRLDNGWLYSTHKPCLDCTKLIAVSGIRRIVYKELYPSEHFPHPTLEIVQYGVV
jgi:dCMP deaminase